MMRCAALWLLLTGLSAAAPSLPEAKVLLVDSTRVETETQTLKRIGEEADARQPPLLKAQRQQGVELALSEILTVMPEVVAAVAQAHGADLVVQASAWPADAATVPPDVTAEVIAEIDRRLADLRFQLP